MNETEKLAIKKFAFYFFEGKFTYLEIEHDHITLRIRFGVDKSKWFKNWNVIHFAYYSNTNTLMIGGHSIKLSKEGNEYLLYCIDHKNITSTSFNEELNQLLKEI